MLTISVFYFIFRKYRPRQGFIVTKKTKIGIRNYGFILVDSARKLINEFRNFYLDEHKIVISFSKKFWINPNKLNFIQHKRKNVEKKDVSQEIGENSQNKDGKFKKKI